MSSDDQLRRLLEELRPPEGFDVDGDLAEVRRRGGRRARGRGRVFLAAAAVIALVAGTVGVVAAVRVGRDGGGVAGGGGTPACVVPGSIQGDSTTFATGTLPDGQAYELRSRGSGLAFEAELRVNGNQVVVLVLGGDSSGSVVVRSAQNAASGGVPVLLGRAPSGRSVRLTFDSGETVEYPLVDGPGGRRWFVGLLSGGAVPRSVEVVGADGSSRVATLLSTPPECVSS